MRLELIAKSLNRRFLFSQENISSLSTVITTTSKLTTKKFEKRPKFTENRANRTQQDKEFVAQNRPNIPTTRYFLIFHRFFGSIIYKYFMRLN